MRILAVAMAAMAGRALWHGWKLPWDGMGAAFRRLPEGAQMAIMGALALAFYLAPGLLPSLLLYVVLSRFLLWRPDLGLTAVALAIPFFLQTKAFGEARFSMVELLLLPTALAWGWRELRGAVEGAGRPGARLAALLRRLVAPRDALDWSVLLFALWAAASLFFAPLFGVAAREFRVVVGESALFFWLIRRLGLDAAQRQRLVGALIAAGTVTALYGLYQWFFTADIIQAEGVRRVRGPYASPNNLSLLLVRVLAMAGGVALLAPAGRARSAARLAALPLALALFLCLTVASVLTVFFGDRFNGAASSGALTAYAKRASPSAWFELGPCFVVCPAPAQEPAASLTIPVLYGWFTLIAAVGVLVTIAIVGVLAGRSWRPTPSALLAEAWPAGTWAPTDAADRAATQPCGGGTAPNPATGPVARAVFGRRVLAAIAHRAEPLIALLLTCILGAGLVVFAGHLAFPTWGGWSTALTAGGFALSTFGVLALGLASGTTAGDRPKRPLGIIWDLACLVPRACHPLGPPCYGERVVPELISRMHWWLAGEGDQTVLGSDRAVSTSPRAVIVSAHSLGGPLVVGALLGAPGDPTHDDWMLPRVGLVTYGCQLRAYFSRFFPELYGPAVLGVVPAAAASLRHADPWEGQWTEAGGEVSLPQVLNGSVRWALGGHGADPRSEFAPGRWVNLWRLTDYLGMPVVAMPPRAGMASTGSPMKPLRDWYAEEVDDTAYLLAVLTHSDYPRSEEYNKALDALVGDLHPETAPGSDGPTPTGSAAVAGQARISRTEGEE